MKLRLLDLFSGIGGFSLGLERSGLCETVAFCEIEDFPRRVLAKHWPKVPVYNDIRTLTADTLAGDGIAVDAICGGFPCQDLSHAGKRAGLVGERSGLWSEYRRLIGEIRPRLVIVENVTGLLSLGLGDVLGDLAALGYDAVWHCIPASYVGAWHRRDRVWLVAYSQCERGREGCSEESFLGLTDLQVQLTRGFERWAGRSNIPAPYLCRGADGVSDRAHRIKALGNAVVPQIPELIGRAILAALNNNQEHGLAISTPIPRADAGKNACSASQGVKLVPARICVASKDQDSAPPVSNNPRPSIDGLPCASPPGANLAGGGLSNRSQPLSFQSGDHFPNEFASSFPSQFVAPSRGVKP